MTATPSLTVKSRDVWLVRGFFFLVTGGSGFLVPFLPLFYSREGLSGTQIGLLGTTAAVAKIIAAPLWGRWSDQTTQPRRLILITLVGSSLAMLALSQQTIFIWMAAIVAFDALVAAGGTALSDALALGITDGANYGSIRLWGSLGWAGLVLVSGWLISQTGLFVAFGGYATGLLFLSAPGGARRDQQ